MLRVKIYPPVDFLVSFLQTKGLLIVDSRPHILHYTGNDQKELKRILREDHPDLLINHSFPSFDIKDQIQVYHPVRSERDLVSVKKIYTNRFGLCQHYYQRIGLQANINLILPKKPKEKGEFKFVFIPKICLSWWKHFKRFMLWE